MPTLANMNFGSLSALMTEIDDWCGTKPRKWPFPPKPHGVRDVLVAIAIHNLAAQLSDAKLGGQVQDLAAQAFATGGKKIAG